MTKFWRAMVLEQGGRKGKKFVEKQKDVEDELTVTTYNVPVDQAGSVI